MVDGTDDDVMVNVNTLPEQPQTPSKPKNNNKIFKIID